MSGDPVGDLVRLDTARHQSWRRVRDALTVERDRRARDLVRGMASYDAYLGVAGECRGLDIILKTLDKEFS